MRPQDWPAVRGIYAEGIETGDATCETEVPEWSEWDAAHLPEHRFVACSGDAVVGWVACSPVSDRCAYRGVVEHSVYVAPAAQGRGLGRALLQRLIASTGAAGIWTIQAGVFPENVRSLALHESCGFRRVGVRERLGEHRGRWRDVILLEHRAQSRAGSGSVSMASVADDLMRLLGAWTSLLRSGTLTELEQLLDEQVVWQGILPEQMCHGRGQVLDILVRNRGRPPRLTRIEAEQFGDRVAVSAEGPDFPENEVLAAEAPRSLVFTFTQGRVVRMQSCASRDQAFALAAG